MKMKLIPTETIKIEKEIELPFYVHFQDINHFIDTYIKVTEKRIYEIEIEHFGETKIHSRKNTGVIPEIYFKNISDAETFKEALNNVKESLKEFES